MPLSCVDFIPITYTCILQVYIMCVNSILFICLYFLHVYTRWHYASNMCLFHTHYMNMHPTSVYHMWHTLYLYFLHVYTRWHYASNMCLFHNHYMYMNPTSVYHVCHFHILPLSVLLHVYKRCCDLRLITFLLPTS